LLCESATSRYSRRKISTDDELSGLNGLVVDGLKHGFFDYSIACEIGNGGKRNLVIRAGKSLKFTIPAEEVPQ
jgi:hypothetical protein